MAATTFSWAVGQSADWNTPADWGGTLPTSGSTALFGSAASGSAYTVTLGSGESFTIGSLQLSAPSGSVAIPTLSITGTLIVSSINYSGGTGGVGTNITINPGGRLDVNTISTSSIKDSGSIAETITISGQGSGGTMELAGASDNNTSVTFSFLNNSSGKNAGLLKFDTLSSSLKSASQNIQNFAWGDKLEFVGQNFTGAVFTYVGTTLTVTSGGTTLLTVFNLSGPGLTSSSFVAGSGAAADTITVVCFARGTRIQTPSGGRRVESLRAGETVTVLQDGVEQARTIRWVGHRRIDLAAHPRPDTVAPVRIRAGAFAEGMPVRDLLVSPDHALFVDGRLIAARQLLNGTSIAQEERLDAIDYYHVELDSHAILLAEGLPAESYLDTGNRGFFQNSGSPLELHPDLTEDRSDRAAGACAPFVVDEDSVRPVWQRFADRAASLGMAPVLPDVSTDPDLRIVAKGRTIKPIYGRNGLCIFPLPLGATGVRIVSRAAQPNDSRPWLNDRRRLGVCVARIALRTADDIVEIPVDHPDLTEGWWSAESSQTLSRWTDGSALLPLPAVNGHAMLELHLHGEMAYPVPAQPKNARAA